MKLRPEEITAILKDRIKEFDVETDLSEVGSVLQVGDGIARVHGLENCVTLERLEFEHGVVGIAFNLEEDNVGVALFGDWEHVKEGEPVRRTGEVMSVPVGEGMLGRVAERVDDAPEEPLADRDAHHRAGAAHRLALLDVLPLAEERDADVVLLQVEGDAYDAVLELEALERDAVLKPVDAGDAVADLKDGADLGEVGLDVVLLDPLLQDRGDLFGT